MKLIIPLLVLILGSCAGQQNYSNKVVNISDLDDRSLQIVVEYKIGIGDTLNINVWKNPDLSVTVPVRPDGKISAPLIGDCTSSDLLGPLDSISKRHISASCFSSLAC